MQVSQLQFDRQNCLKISQLECIRDDRVLFENLSFQLNAGELIQIEGHNGSGKTSLLRILCGLSLPESGQIFWQNQDIEQDKTAYWEHLSYIGHAPGVKGELTPIENLQMAKAIASRPTSVSLESVLEQVGLYGFEDVPTRTLSAGQQRRVALARLLTNDVQLWILDEPFTALDKKAIQMVERLLDQHAQRGGMAIVTSHHHVNCEYARILKLA
jgi:heme exporter protein A